MKTVKICKDPFGTGRNLFTKSQVELYPGVTVLVGCNGSGKSTFLREVESQMKAETVPFRFFERTEDGRRGNILYNALEGDDLPLFSTAFHSSEGENIYLAVSKLASILHTFVTEGTFVDKEQKFLDAFTDDDVVSSRYSKLKAHPERWLLMDAIDSGFSLDNIVDLKGMFNCFIEDCNSAGKDCYVVVAANSFELVRGEVCLDVRTGEYVEFKDYEDYRKFVLRSRNSKDKRLSATCKKK